MVSSLIFYEKIVVASKNEVKIGAAREAFMLMFPGDVPEYEGVSVSSGVADQPLSDTETYTGAHNRITALVANVPDADYYVAFEGGLEDTQDGMEVFAWVLIQNKDGLLGKARTATFIIPEAVAAHVRKGIELGAADDLVFGRTHSGHGNGIVGLLTGDVISRTSYYVDAAVLALIPFKNPELY